MNIAFLNAIDKETFGGVEHWMEIVGAGLINKGHRVLLIGREHSEFLRIASEGHPDFMVCPLKISGDFNPTTIYNLNEIIKEFEIDIIVANFNKAVRLGGLAAKIAGKTKLIWRIGLNLTKNNFIHRFLTPKLIDGLISPSYSLRDEIVSSGYIKEEQVTVIPTGIDNPKLKITKEEARAELNTKYNIPEDAILAVTSGRFVEQKGHSVLIDAAVEISKKFPNIRFLLLGNGPLELKLRGQIAKNNLNEHFIFAGFLDKFELELLGSDLMIHPSLFEPFGIVLVEGMRASLPIVASRVGGIPEVVEENETAFLVEPENSEMLSHKVCELLSDRELFNKMSQSSYDRWKNEFSYSVMVNRVEDCLKRTIGETH